MKYNKFTYLYPTRPEEAVMVEMLPYYEKKGYIAQVKKNGTCAIMATVPDGVIVMNRHNEPMKKWQITEEIKNIFSKIPPWYYFCGELLHSKTPHIKNTLYLYDMLVEKGEYLVGKDYASRYKGLLKVFGIIDTKPQYYVVSEHLWIARNYTENFKEVFLSLEGAENEGLVLKDPKGVLDMCGKQTNKNGKWQRKIRKNTKNYAY